MNLQSDKDILRIHSNDLDSAAPDQGLQLFLPFREFLQELVDHVGMELPDLGIDRGSGFD